MDGYEYEEAQQIASRLLARVHEGVTTAGEEAP
jgi:hypothetical protein